MTKENEVNFAQLRTSEALYTKHKFSYTTELNIYIWQGAVIY
jgi:hypothetical protein